MISRKRFGLVFSLLFLILFSVNFHSIQAAQPVVYAVLFYSPSCPHCHEVINNDLPPLVEKYGDQLQIVGVDVTNETGQNLYQAMINHFDVPDDRLGVPTLVVGETVLVGSSEIPDIFPKIIEEGIGSGGIDWPDIPGLREALIESGAYTEQDFSIEEEESGATYFYSKFIQDPIANSVAVLVLFGMVASVVGIGYSFIKGTDSKFLQWPRWVIPVLAIIGIGVALYMSYVEVTRSEAVCGPVGDCNSVQESHYALLFGVIPIGFMGVVGYVAILAAWLLQEYGPTSWEKYFTLAIWGMAWFGVLFSIYLTFLEPFIIGATCAWCITSAIVMTLTLLGSAEPAKLALKFEDSDSDEQDFTDEAEEEATNFEDALV